MRHTIPLQSHGCGAAQHQSNTSAVSEEEKEEEEEVLLTAYNK